MARIDITKAEEIVLATNELASNFGISLQKLMGIIGDSRNSVDKTLEQEDKNYLFRGILTEISTKLSSLDNKKIKKINYKEISFTQDYNIKQIIDHLKSLISDKLTRRRVIFDELDKNKLMTYLFLLGLDEYVEKLGKYDEFKMYYEQLKPLYYKLKETVRQVEETQETTDFGTPDQEQQKMIDSWSPEFRQIMIEHKLKYTENTIELVIDGEKIVFDKEQPIKEKMNWKDSMNAIEKLNGRKAVDKDLMHKLVTIFKGKADVIGLDNDFYWSNSVVASNTFYVYYECFCNYHEYTYTYKTNTLYPICIHV